jgi:hypothetical protein
MFDPRHCRQNAERFSTEKFKASLSAFIEVRLARFRAELHGSELSVETGGDASPLAESPRTARASGSGMWH